MHQLLLANNQALLLLTFEVPSPYVYKWDLSLVINVPADVLATYNPMPSATTELTKLGMDFSNFLRLLTHLPLVPHICISELGQHWFRKWLVAYSAPSHYLNQCCLIVNWTIQWNFNQNTKFFIYKMHLKMSSAKWRPLYPRRDESRISNMILLISWRHSRW